LHFITASTETSSQHAQLHQELVTLFDRELVFEIILVLGQDIELRENAQYNLLVMELLHHLVKSQDPTAVARSIVTHNTSKSSSNNQNNTSRTASAANAILPQKLFRTGLLSDRLQQEKSKLHALAGPRHAHFGGTWMTERVDGKRSYVGATEEQQQQRQHSDWHSASATVAKRKNRKAEPFIGATTKHNALFVDGPSTKRAQVALNSFCHRFVEQCYGPVMKSLKNEFRRDSVRLEEGDKVVFFRIVWFFCQWWRVHEKLTRNSDKNHDETVSNEHRPLPLGKLIFTMDVFTFNLVLNATDSFSQQKKYARLGQAVALFSEMMHLLQEMYHSREDSMENIMAMGLMDRLFYGSDPLDRLPKLVKLWAPATTTRDYLCDLCEVLHVTLKLLDANAKSCGGDDEHVQSAKGKDKKSSKKKSKDAVPTGSNDAVAKMKAAVAEFNVTDYFVKKLVCNNLVFMFTHLLGQYAVNPAHVNHHIVALFLRLSRLEVVSAADQPNNLKTETFASDPLLAVQTVTLEPMLYNIQLFLVLERILNDSSLRKKEKEHASLLAFGANVITKFADAAARNPTLYVECLFRHNPFHRFCELSTHLYVNEELRMIAERELLLEEHRRSLEEGGGEDNDEDFNEDDNDNEVEFQDDGDDLDALPARPSSSKRKHLSSHVSSESSDSEPESEIDAPASSQRLETSPTKSKPVEKSSRQTALADSSNDLDMEAEEDTSPIKSSEAKSPSTGKRRKRMIKKGPMTDGYQSTDDEMEFGDEDTASKVNHAEGTQSTTAAAKSKTRFFIEDDEIDE
jgi:timeless